MVPLCGVTCRRLGSGPYKKLLLQLAGTFWVDSTEDRLGILVLFFNEDLQQTYLELAQNSAHGYKLLNTEMLAQLGVNLTTSRELCPSLVL